MLTERMIVCAILKFLWINHKLLHQRGLPSHLVMVLWDHHSSCLPHRTVHRPFAFAAELLTTTLCPQEDNLTTAAAKELLSKRFVWHTTRLEQAC